MDPKDIYDLTPLHIAASYRSLDLMHLLFERGADPNNRTKYQESIVHAIAEKGWIDIMNIFVRHGVELDVKNKNGHTPAQIAEYHGHMTMSRKFAV